MELMCKAMLAEVDNFNENLINGFDLALQFTKTFGDFRVSAGASASHWTNTRTQDDPVPELQREMGYNAGR